MFMFPKTPTTPTLSNHTVPAEDRRHISSNRKRMSQRFFAVRLKQLRFNKCHSCRERENRIRCDWRQQIIQKKSGWKRVRKKGRKKGRMDGRKEGGLKEGRKKRTKEDNVFHQTCGKSIAIGSPHLYRLSPKQFPIKWKCFLEVNYFRFTHGTDISITTVSSTGIVFCNTSYILLAGTRV